MNSVIRSFQLDKIESTIKINECKLLRRVWPDCGRVKNAFFRLDIVTQVDGSNKKASNNGKI